MEVPYSVCLTTDPPISGDKYTPEPLKAQNQSLPQSCPLPDDKDKEEVIFFWASLCILGYIICLGEHAEKHHTELLMNNKFCTFLVPWKKKKIPFLKRFPF